MKILKERLSPSEKWGPAIEILPRDYNYHPLNFEPEDFLFLEGSPAFFNVVFGFATLVKNYVEIYRKFKENEVWGKFLFFYSNLKKKKNF